MDEKTILTLEFPKILERLAGYAAFSASAELARSLRPFSNPEEVLNAQARTIEARHLLSLDFDFSVGSACDVRSYADLAARRGVLEPAALLEVKNTLISARNLVRTFERQEQDFPALKELVGFLTIPTGLIDSITRVLSDSGEVLDRASDKLASIRRELKTAHERLLARLERLLNDPNTAPMLQENIITQRNGRYVIPLRADFKGRVRSIIHDQSASGATLFVEPLAVVELNNHWHEYQLAERDEERRILAELSDQVGEKAAEINALVDVLARIDLALMCAKYADDLHANAPVLIPFKSPKQNHPGSTICLLHARHPLLDPARAVPIEVELDPATYAAIITGPNTGGKTVSLKTVGLMVLMAQSGLHIPAQSGSTLSIFEDVYADIGDEQSIEQSLSTFSGHVTNIIRVLKGINSRSLVLFDELGAGTDPQEGAALARAILEHLVKKPVTCLVATHYPELKIYAHQTPGVTNASMEFNLRTLKPTYHLIIGLPGHSNALLIAERLGLDPEIIQTARTELNPADLQAGDLLDEIHRQRNLARKAHQQAEDERRTTHRLKRDLEVRLEKVEEERLTLLENARQEAEEELESLRFEMEEARRALIRARQPLEVVKEVAEHIEAAEVIVEKPVRRSRRPRSTAGPVGPRPFKVGQRVRLRSLKTEAVLMALNEEEAEVQIGSLRMRTRPEDLQHPAEPEPGTPPPAATQTLKHKTAEERVSLGGVMRPSPGMELDLRGKTADEALPELEHYIDEAFLSGMPFVRIIHGKGTGRLREAVRAALRGSQQVSGWQSGQDGEGGEGVTVAKIRQD